MTALVVDDERMQLDLIRAVLERAGHKAITAASGAEAIRAFEKIDGAIDLLITDVVMPDMDGPAVAATLCAKKPDLPVLFVSGFLAQYEGLVCGTHAAAHHFLAKPFSPAALISEVKKTLSSGGGRK